MKNILTGICVLLFAATVYAQTPDAGQKAGAPETPVIVTTGEGVVKRAPDRVWVSVAAESRAKSPR